MEEDEEEFYESILYDIAMSTHTNIQTHGNIHTHITHTQTYTHI